MDETTGEELNEETGDEVVETSLRDDLEAAIVTEEASEESQENEQNEETIAPKKDDKEIGGEAAKDETVEGGKGGGKPSGINAPIGFSPESREKWKDVPDVVKEQVAKREKDIIAAMANTAEARRSHAEISKLAQSYAPVLAAEGAETPMHAINALFKTVAELRMGTPQQTATRMAGLIKHYNIDIGMLDSVLSGDMSAQNTDDSRLAKMLDERLAPVNDLLRGNKAREEATATANQEAVNKELQEFSENAEFLADVRNDMADLIDLASKHNRKMSFKEAYDKACAMNPEISNVLSQRAEEEKLKNSGQRLRNKRAAASSVRQSSGSGSAGKQDNSLRGALEEAWDAAE